MEVKEAILPSYLEGEYFNLVTGLFPSLFSSFTASTSKLVVVITCCVSLSLAILQSRVEARSAYPLPHRNGKGFHANACWLKEGGGGGEN